MIELDNATKDTIRRHLKHHNLEDYTRQVELLILGQLPGNEILRLIHVFCQSSYLRGRVAAASDFNEAIRRATLGGNHA